MSHFQKLSKGNFYYFIPGFECVTIQHFPQIGVRFHVNSERVGAEEQMQMKKIHVLKCSKYKSINELIAISGNEKKWHSAKMDVPFPTAVHSGAVF